MKKLLAMLLCAISAGAANTSIVTGPLSDISAAPYNTSRVEFWPISTPLANGMTLVVGPMKNKQPVGGEFSITLVTGYYKAYFRPTTNSITIWVPGDSTTNTIASLALDAASMVEVPLYKVKINNADTNPGYLAAKMLAGANITYTTNTTLGTITISGDAGGSATNVWRTAAGTNIVVVTNEAALLYTVHGTASGSAFDTTASNSYNGTFTGNAAGMTNQYVVANTLFVRTNGVNATARKGAPELAWRDLDPAVTAAAAGDLITIGAGTFLVTNALSKNGVNYLASPQSTIISSNTTMFTDGGSATTNYVRGGRWIQDVNQIGYYDTANSLLVLDVESIDAVGSSGMFSMGGGRLYVRASHYLSAPAYDIVYPGIADWQEAVIEAPYIYAGDTVLESGPTTGPATVRAGILRADGASNWALWLNTNSFVECGYADIRGRLGGAGGMMRATKLQVNTTNLFGILGGLCSSYGTLKFVGTQFSMGTNSFGLMNCTNFTVVFDHCELVSTHANPFATSGSTVIFGSSRTNGVMVNTPVTVLSESITYGQDFISGDSLVKVPLTLLDANQSDFDNLIISATNALFGRVFHVTTAGQISSLGGLTTSSDVIAGNFIGNGSGLTTIGPQSLNATNSGTVGQVAKRINATQWYWANDDSGGGGGGPLSGGFTNGSGQITADGHAMELIDPNTGWTNANWSDQTLSTANTNVLDWFNQRLIGLWLADSLTVSNTALVRGTLTVDGVSQFNSVMYAAGLNDTETPAWMLTLQADNEIRYTRNGGLLTNLNASALASGTVPADRLGALTNSQFYTLSNAVAVAGTSVLLDRGFTFPATDAGRIAIGFGTTNCEIRECTTVSGNQVSFVRALTFAHAAGEKVMWFSGDAYASFWAMEADLSSTFNGTDNAWALLQALWDCGEEEIRFRGEGSYGIGFPMVLRPSQELQDITVGALSTPYTAHLNTNSWFMINQQGERYPFTVFGSNTIYTGTSWLPPAGASNTMIVCYGIGGTNLPSGLTNGIPYFVHEYATNWMTVKLRPEDTGVITLGTGTGYVYTEVGSLNKLYLDNVTLDGGTRPDINGLYANMQQPAEFNYLRLNNFLGTALKIPSSSQQLDINNLEIDTCGIGLDTRGARFIYIKTFNCEGYTNALVGGAHIWGMHVEGQQSTNGAVVDLTRETTADLMIDGFSSSAAITASFASFTNFILSDADSFPSVDLRRLAFPSAASGDGMIAISDPAYGIQIEARNDTNELGADRFIAHYQHTTRPSDVSFNNTFGGFSWPTLNGGLVQFGAQHPQHARFILRAMTNQTGNTFEVEKSDGSLTFGLTPSGGVRQLDSSSTSSNYFAANTNTFAGRLMLPAGIVGSPAIQFSDDADGTGSGMYRTGANEVAFAVNGVRQWQITPTKVQTDTGILALGTLGDVTVSRSAAGTLRLLATQQIRATTNTTIEGVLTATNGLVHATNTFVGSVTGAPANVTDPAGWMPITNNGALYFIKLYQ